MGEAMLVRKDGAVLRELTLISPPDKLSYYVGEFLDMEGAIVGAKFGMFTIPLHETGWSYSPTRALVGTDNAILISATVGRITKTCSIPITVQDFSNVLNDNSWERIATAASLGIASQLWNIGDSKYFTLNGVQHEARIIAFDADPLATADERYNDTSYNGNKKKAAIVFQFFTSPGKSTMHNYSSEIAWDQCYMRTTTIANLYNSLPSDMKSVIRLVKKYSYNGRLSRSYETADRLFLESVCEIFSSPSGAGGGTEKTNSIFYTWYANGNQPIHTVYNWTRSMHSPCSVENHFVGINTNGGMSYPSFNSQYDYFPMFCL